MRGCERVGEGGRGGERVGDSSAARTTSVMLFLNKRDIFEDKLQYSDIAAQKPFADYAGPPNDFNNGVLYFIEKFKDCLINDEITDSFITACTATDTSNSKFDSICFYGDCLKATQY